MEDVRSMQCVFVSHCLLAQGVRANGVAKYYPGPFKPVIRFCLDHDINIMQMPCPEMLSPAGGLDRDPHGKKWYEKNGLRKMASRIALKQVRYMENLIEHGFEILAIIGMDYSPACAVNYMTERRVFSRTQGIYIEELQRLLSEKEMDITFIGVNPRAEKKLDRELNGLLMA